MSADPTSQDRWELLKRNIELARRDIYKHQREVGVIYLGYHDYVCMRTNATPYDFSYAHDANEERYRGIRVIRVQVQDYLHVAEKPL